ncbi:MAG: hypothetical protein U0136_21280 [Bdellovibrionota bacterium]
MLRKLSIICSSVMLLSLISCSGLRSASPEDAQRVLSVASSYRGGNKSLGNTKETRLPLKAGQWAAVLIRSKTEPNDVTLQITKVAEASGHTVTIELEQYPARDGGKRTVIQQRMQNVPSLSSVYTKTIDAAAVRDIKVDRVRIMGPDGQIQELPQLPFAAGGVGANFLQSSIAMGDVKSEPCQSTEIKASRCYVVPYEVKVLWFSDHGTTYAHSDIPVLGFIRSDGEKSEMTVIGYGTSGASVLIH